MRIEFVISDCQQLNATDSKSKNVVKHEMEEVDEPTAGPSTSRSGAKQNEKNSNIRSMCCRNS